MTSVLAHCGKRGGAILVAPANLALLAALVCCAAAAFGQSAGNDADGRRFYPDDPLWLDSDMMDIPPVADFELYKDADFLINSFIHPGGDAGPALNINTLGEVPDSS